MTASLLAWAEGLERSGLVAAMRDHAWPYPVANVIHVLGVALLVGAILALDARLLGAARNAVAADGAARLLLPVATAGAALAVPSGILLFLVDASALTDNRLMQAKVALLLAGAANAVAFHLLWRHHLRDWDLLRPPAGRAQAGVSLVIWIAVLSCGRLIAYV